MLPTNWIIMPPVKLFYRLGKMPKIIILIVFWYICNLLTERPELKLHKGLKIQFNSLKGPHLVFMLSINVFLIENFTTSLTPFGKTALFGLSHRWQNPKINTSSKGTISAYTKQVFINVLPLLSSIQGVHKIL